MKDQEVSIIYLPIEISKSYLEYQINQLIDGVVYEDTNLDDDGIMFKAEKIEKITLEMDESSIRYRVPLKIWVKKDIGLTKVEAVGAIALDFSTDYNIQPDWHLETTTHVNNFEWLDKPKVKFALFDISIKLIANKILRRSEEIICRSIDEQLARRFNLRNIISTTWEKIQNPFSITEQFNTSLQIIPEDFAISPLQFEGDQIFTKGFLTAKNNISLGIQTKPSDPTALPDFQFKELPSDHFSIQLYGNATYDEVDVLAKKYLRGRGINAGDFSIVIDDIDLRGGAEKLNINVQVSGSFSGTIQLNGKPFFNTNENQIEFSNFEYEIKPRNILMKGLVWIFQNKLDELFKKFLKLPLAEQLENIRNLIQQKLDEFTIAENIFLNGNLEKVEVKTINLKPDHLEVELKAKGQLHLKIKKELNSPRDLENHST